METSSDYMKELNEAIAAWKEELANNLAPITDPNLIWVVLVGTESIPLAAFTNQEYADIMAGHFPDAQDPIQVNRTETVLIVDQYKEEVSNGKMPFEIIVKKDGSIFDCFGPEDGIRKLIEPVISSHSTYNIDEKKFVIDDQKAGVTGVFWGLHQYEAMQNAKSFWQQLSQDQRFA
jgi:hypothetical protein